MKRYACTCSSNHPTGLKLLLVGCRQRHSLACSFLAQNADGEEMSHDAGLPGRTGSCGKTHPQAEVSGSRPAVCSAAHSVGASLCGRPSQAEAHYPAHSLRCIAHRQEGGCNRVWPAFCPGGAFEHQLTGLPYCGCMEVSVEGVLQANSHIVIFMGCWRVLS